MEINDNNDMASGATDASQTNLTFLILDFFRIFEFSMEMDITRAQMNVQPRFSNQLSGYIVGTQNNKKFY